MNRIFGRLVLFLLAAALPAAGQGLPNIGGNSGGNSLSLPLALPGGVAGNLTVSFESVTGLSLPNLGVSAQLVSPTDAGLLARLPTTVAIPAGFPVLVRIEPTAAGGLAFTGVATIQLRSLSLLQAPDSPRLYAAPAGGPFTDITNSVHQASDLKLDTSYRVIGSRGGFSEFLIVSDHTPADQAVAAKLDQLDQTLADNAAAIPAALHADLANQLAGIRVDVLAGDAAAAIQSLDLFQSTVEAHSGTDIPDLWRAAHDRIDVAGLLRAAAKTLRFSLGQVLDP